MPSTNIGGGGVGGAIGVGRDTGVIEIVVVPGDEVVVPGDEVVVPVDEVVVPVDEVVVPGDEVVVPVDEVVVPVDEGAVPVSRKNNDTALGMIPPPSDATQQLNNRFLISL